MIFIVAPTETTSIDVGALHASVCRACADEVAFADFGAHGGKAFHVLVDRAYAAEVAPARHRNLSGSEAAEQRADQIVGSANTVRKLLRNLRGADVTAVDLNVGAVEKADRSAELLKDFQKSGHVRDLRNVFDAADSVDQKGCGDDGNSGVFRAADMNFAKERLPAPNDIFCHEKLLDGRMMRILFT